MSGHLRLRGWVVVLLALTGPAASSLAAQPFRVRSYTIDATFEPARERMSAVAGILFEPGTTGGNTLCFYLHGELRVDSVKVAGVPFAFSQEIVCHEDDYSRVANRIEIEVRDVDLSGGVVIGYSGYFHPSVAGAISNYMRIDGGGVFLRSVGYSLWFPVAVESWRDSHEVSFPSVKLRTPPGFRAVFAGHRVREFEDGDWRVSEWSAPELELFDAQCTARRFDVLKGGGFELYHLRDPAAGERAREILSFTSRLESFYRTHYRRAVSDYSFCILQMPEFGDIASGNVIGLSDEVWNEFDESAWQGRTVAHELVHPFVSLPSTEELAALVIEGFPSYFHLPALADDLGEEWYGRYMDDVERAYVGKRLTGKGRRGNPLPQEKAIFEITAGEIGVYKDRFVLSDRVLLFFDFLRRRMGGATFLRFTSDLLNRDRLDLDTVVGVVESYLPGSGGDVRRWLKTTEFPDRWRRVQP